MQNFLIATRTIGIALLIAITGCTGAGSGRTFPATPIATAAGGSADEAPPATGGPATPSIHPQPATPDRPAPTRPRATATQLVPSPTRAPLTIEAREFGNAVARYDPDTEALLLANGYTANIIVVGDRRGLRASQLSYTNSVWTRDLDYAISGYSYALGDMRVMRENIELFLVRVSADGIAPETIYIRENRLDHENRQAWDSMPNLIHAVYVYVAKTGDRDFYRTHRDTLQRIGNWIVSKDSDGDGLPDGDDFPYGYFDSVYNSLMHTYAMAKFHAAFNELAELEQAIGADGTIWTERAGQLRRGFHRAYDQGGYWLPGQPWPVAWRQADGSPVALLETFGVFAALRSGLIGPSDGARYRELVTTLHTLLPDLIDEPTPLRLTLGGYEPGMRREVDPPVPLWMLDASAPWIVGLAAPAYAAAGYPADARTLVQAYTDMARSTNPPVLEFAAGPGARYGPGNSGDGGRTWDSAAWFLAVYGGHYGLRMTPSALIVQPNPFVTRPDDGIQNLSYQGAYVQFTLDAAQMTYSIQADRQIDVVLRPIGSAKRVRVNGGAPQTEAAIRLQPGRVYSVVSEHEAATGAPPPANGLFADSAFQAVWERTDLPLARGVAGLSERSWLWGDAPLTGGFREPYRDAPGNARLVQYFDKSRMEISNPAAPQGPWYVTNGLLVVEMITGELQVGDTTFDPRSPAQVAVAGDPEEHNPAAPTYRSLRSVAYPVQAQPAPRRSGAVVTSVLTKDGQTFDDPALARYNVVLDTYDEQLGHNIPGVFTDFFARQGLIYEGGRFVQGQIMDWTFAVGLPLSEPYWARVRVGGVERDVLIQAFERRVLTYTPDNAPAWRVEMGNVGQHYLRWRYGQS